MVKKTIATCILLVLITCVKCQFQGNFGPQAFLPQGQGPDGIPLGLSEQQGQQLVNQITQQVMNSIGSTSQINNFQTPGGISQRFGSFSPDQLLPPGVDPVGGAPGQFVPQGLGPAGPLGQWNPQGVNPTDLSGPWNAQGIDPAGFADGSNSDRFGNRPVWQNSIGRGPLSRNELAGGFGGPFNNIVPFSGRSDIHPLQGGTNRFGPRLGQREGRGIGLGLLGGGLISGLSNLLGGSSNHDHSHSDIFHDHGPFAAQGLHPIETEIQINERLRQRLQELHDKSYHSPLGKSSPLEDIRRENRKLRKLIRKKKQKLNKRNDVKHKDEKKKKGGLAAGLALGAIGALLLG